MGASASKIPEAIKESISYFNDIINSFKALVGANLSENKNIRDGLDSLIRNNNEMNDQEKDAVKQILECHDKIMAAQISAKLCVRRIQSLAKGTRITLDYATSFELTGKALELYVKRGNAESKSLEEAIKAMTAAGSACDNARTSIKQLMNWCNRKKEELEAELQTMKGSERGKAYGGAAGATVGTAVVCACIPVIGWLLAPIITSSVAAISFGTAAGVAEGHTIPQIIEMMNTSKEGLDTAKTGFEKMAKDLGQHSADIEKKKELLTNIFSALLDTIAGAENVLGMECEGMIPGLKGQFVKLENLCASFEK